MGNRNASLFLDTLLLSLIERVHVSKVCHFVHNYLIIYEKDKPTGLKFQFISCL